MKKTIKRIRENIKWFCNHPPTSLKDTADPRPCGYCKKIPTCGSFDYSGIVCICANCRKKLYDKIYNL